METPSHDPILFVPRVSFGEGRNGDLTKWMAPWSLPGLPSGGGAAKCSLRGQKQTVNLE